MAASLRRVPRIEQEAAAFGFGSLRDDVFAWGNASCDFDEISFLRCVFDHDYGVCARRHRSARHDGEGFASIQGGWRLRRARFDFSHHFQLGWERCQIGCAYCVAIAGGAWEGRDVAIGGDGLGEDSAGGLQEGHGFVGS